MGKVTDPFLELLLTLRDFEDRKCVSDITNVMPVLGIDPDIVIACIQALG